MKLVGSEIGFEGEPVGAQTIVVFVAEMVFGLGLVWDYEPTILETLDLPCDVEGGFVVVHGFPWGCRKKATRHFEDIRGT